MTLAKNYAKSFNLILIIYSILFFKQSISSMTLSKLFVDMRANLFVIMCTSSLEKTDGNLNFFSRLNIFHLGRVMCLLRNSSVSCCLLDLLDTSMRYSDGRCGQFTTIICSALCIINKFDIEVLIEVFFACLFCC